MYGSWVLQHLFPNSTIQVFGHTFRTNININLNRAHLTHTKQNSSSKEMHVHTHQIVGFYTRFHSIEKNRSTQCLYWIGIFVYVSIFNWATPPSTCGIDCNYYIKKKRTTDKFYYHKIRCYKSNIFYKVCYYWQMLYYFDPSTLLPQSFAIPNNELTGKSIDWSIYRARKDTVIRWSLVPDWLHQLGLASACVLALLSHLIGCWTLNRW